MVETYPVCKVAPQSEGLAMVTATAKPAATLASANDSLLPEYDIVVVGSRYGGAITAARLGVANALSGR